MTVSIPVLDVYSFVPLNQTEGFMAIPGLLSSLRACIIQLSHLPFLSAVVESFMVYGPI